MVSVPLNQSGQVTLDVTGSGTAKVGPLSGRETWHPANVHVSANAQPINDAQCQVFVGTSPTQNCFRDGTFTGSSGDSTDRVNADTVDSGSYVWAVWTGGDPGVVATLTVTGLKDV